LRTYLPDLARYGDDGTAQAYVSAIFALPAMADWVEGARRETEAGN
jgi:glutathione S-transferase